MATLTILNTITKMIPTNLLFTKDCMKNAKQVKMDNTGRISKKNPLK